MKVVLIVAALYGSACVLVAWTMAWLTRADVNTEGDPPYRVPSECARDRQSQSLGLQVQGVRVHSHSATAKGARHHV